MKDCPFCGGRPETTRYPRDVALKMNMIRLDIPGNEVVLIQCQDCGASAKPELTKFEAECNWNRRPTNTQN